MENVTERTGDGIVLKISGRVTIADANEFKQMMMREVPSGSNVTIDLTGIDECDLSLFQLLCASHRQLLRTSGSMIPGKYSDEVYETMRSAGILRDSGCIENRNENCLWQRQNKGGTPL